MKSVNLIKVIEYSQEYGLDLDLLIKRKSLVKLMIINRRTMSCCNDGDKVKSMCLAENKCPLRFNDNKAEESYWGCLFSFLINKKYVTDEHHQRIDFFKRNNLAAKELETIINLIDDD